MLKTLLSGIGLFYFRRSSLKVELMILDVNDNKPVFSSPVYRVTVSEKMSVGSVIGQISAADADSSVQNSRVCYELESTEGDNLPFTVNSVTGKSF